MSNNDDGIRSSTVQLTPEEAARLSEDPRNVVYEVTHDEVEYTPMAEVKRIMGIIRTLATQLREDHPDWDDARVRSEIRAKSAAAEKMASSTHPRLFNLITGKSIDEKTADMLVYMIGLHERVERGEISKEESGTQFYVEMLRQNGHGK